MLIQKITKIQQYCSDKNLDYLLLTNFGHEMADAVMYYLLLKNPEHGIFLIPKNGRTTLFITPFEVHQTQAQFPELNVQPFNQKLVELLSPLIKPEATIAIRENVFPTLAHTALGKAGHILKSAEHLDEVLAVKDAAEVEAMRFVTAETDKAFASLIAHWSEFKTERDAARFINQYACEHDCEVSFPTIVASGPHAAHPHHVTDDTEITHGFCVIDMGLRINGYCSDITRTIFIGEPTESDMALYDRLCKAQADTVALVKPEIEIGTLDIFCRRELGELNQFFIHGLGHGVGTQVHEWPAVTEKNSHKLKPGMIITIEPGIYEEGKFGMRIEDDVLVTETGCEVLTKTSKDLIILK